MSSCQIYLAEFLDNETRPRWVIVQLTQRFAPEGVILTAAGDGVTINLSPFICCRGKWVGGVDD
jgi:hypothetical protein